MTGFIQTVIQPGVITELPMANMALSDGRAMLDIDNIHIKADACGGVGTRDVLRRPANHRNPMSKTGDPAASALIGFSS